MDTSLLRKRRTKYYAYRIFPVLVALTAGPGMLKATNLLNVYATSTSTTAITSVSLACSTTAGPSTTTVYVNAATAPSGTNTIAVSVGAVGTGVVVTAPGSQSIAAANVRLAYTIGLAAGCNGVTNNGTPTVVFMDGASAGNTMTVNTTVTATTSGLVAPASVNITCVLSGSTYYAGPAQTVSLTSTATGGTPFGLDTSGGNSPAGWLTLNPSSPAGTASSGGPVTFTVAAAAGCDSLTASQGSNTATTTINLSSTGTAAPDKQISVTLTVSGPSASSLVVNPNPITLTCSKNGSTYTPNFPQTISVTSGATGGTAFTVNNSGSASWLGISSLAGGTASASGVTFTLQAIATGGVNCGGGAVNSSTTTTVHLVNTPALDKVFTVTLQIVPAVILTATPNPASLTYVKGSGTAGYVDVRVASSSLALPSPFFTVNTATLPIWLRLDSTSGVAPQSLRFSSTTVADTLAPGTYNATIVISVAGYGDLNLPVSMLLTNKAPQLTIQSPPSSAACTPASATTFCIPWTIGQGLPTPTLTVISTDTPISYSATSGGLLAPTIPVNEQTGLAYSFGTPISVTFNPQAFAAAQPGNVLTGTVTLTWGSPVSTIVVTFQVTVLSPGATISYITPATLPVVASPHTYTGIALVGTGFVPSTDPTQATKVGLVLSGTTMTTDTNITATIVNQSNITLQITVPAGADPIPFAGGAVNIGVCNPVGGTCSNATSQVTVSFGTNPIVQAVTSSSALLEVSPVSVAPFDMISLFGTNFCPNCTSSQVLTGAPDATTLAYPTSLPFNGSNSLVVTFQPHTGTAFAPTNAPLLFATNNQINLLVPSVVPLGSGNVDIIVSYGSLTGSPAPSVSAPYTVSVVATDPGIFTIGADGQGSGAALDVNYNLISSTNPAGVRVGSGTSDIISIYMTGLGSPDSLGDNASAASGGGFAWSTDCVTQASYLISFNNAQAGTPLGTLDGTLIVPSVLNTGRLVPCIVGSDISHVYIGGQDAVVKYAGWVPGTIAGLYQINVQLPANVASAFTTEAGLTSQSVLAPVQLPVQVVTTSGQSQTGVSLWVAPRLVMTGPTSGAGAAVNTVGGTVGVALISDSTNQVQAAGATGNVTYAVTSGLLPSGLSLDPATGQISGTPAANTNGTYTVTVTATDSAPIPVTGSDTFVVTIGQGLFMTTSTPTVSTFGTANGAVAQISASGGVYPYTYALSISGQSLPVGMTINTATGAISTTAATPAGSYALIVAATDSTGTPLTGNSHFTVVVNLSVVATATGSFTVTGQTSGAYNTIVATGQTGSVTYTLDTATTAWVAANSAWVSFSSGVFTITGTASLAGTYPVTVLATDGTAPTDASAAGTGHTVSFNIVIGS